MFRLMRRVAAKAINRCVSGIFGNVVLAKWRGMKVGEGCRLYIRDFGSEPFLISIGDRVTITQGCLLLTHDGSTWLVRDESGSRYQRFSRITIGSDVFIGANSIILPGVTIGSRVVIGAGSIVTKDVPDNSICVGNPAGRIGSFDEFRARVARHCPNDRELSKSSSRKTWIEEAIALERERTSESKGG